MRIAVVGSGVAGLVSAYKLSFDHEVEVFEASDRIGGHVHTRDIELEGQRLPVDSGFIVFNERNYPGFVDLLKELNVASKPSLLDRKRQRGGRRGNIPRTALAR